MQVNNNGPFSNLVAGQLYDFQTRTLVAQPNKADAKALLLSFIETQKSQEQQAPATKPIAFLEKAQKAFPQIFNAIFEEGDEEIETLSAFVNRVIAEYKSAQDSESAKITAERTLGQLLFLLDFDNIKATEAISQESPQHALATSFSDVVQELRTALDARVIELRKYDIVTESNTLRARELPKTVANALITSTGLFNTAIIDDVKKALFLKGDIESQNEITEVLNSLATNPECYQMLEAAKAPASNELASSPLILAMLDLADDTELCDAHAKECLLSACLSQVVQSPIDDEVSPIFGQLLKQVNLPRFMSDINTLLETGCLTREIEGHPKIVPFTLDGNSSPLQKQLSISSNGSITDRWGVKAGLTANDRLWQVHGIIAACEAMGIEDLEAAVKEALALIGGESPSRRFNTTPKAVIAAMAKGDEAASTEGFIAFTNTYENPLLCGWKGALTAMATIRPRAEQLARVHHAVTETLFSHFTSQDIHERAALGGIYTGFKKNLQTSLATTAPSNTKSFQELVLKALPESEKELPQIKTIQALIKSHAFAKDVSLKFDPKKTPWDSVVRADALSFTKTYMGSENGRFEPKSAHGLFAALLDYSKQLQNSAKGFLSSPQQALVFDATHSAFANEKKRAFWNTYEKQADAVMQEAVRNAEDREAIYSWIKETILDANFREEFANDVAGIGQKITFADFRQSMHNILGHYIQGDGLALANAELDMRLVSLLFSKRNDLFVPFATSTWEMDGVTPQFCFYPDPIDKTVVIGMIRGDTLVRLNQNDWLDGEWEFGQIEASVGA